MNETVVTLATLSVCLLSVVGVALQRMSEQGGRTANKSFFCYTCLLLVSALAVLAFAKGVPTCWAVGCAIPGMAIAFTLDLRGTLHDRAF